MTLGVGGLEEGEEESLKVRGLGTLKIFLVDIEIPNN